MRQLWAHPLIFYCCGWNTHANHRGSTLCCRYYYGSTPKQTKGWHPVHQRDQRPYLYVICISCTRTNRAVKWSFFLANLNDHTSLILLCINYLFDTKFMCSNFSDIQSKVASHFDQKQTCQLLFFSFVLVVVAAAFWVLCCSWYLLHGLDHETLSLKDHWYQTRQTWLNRRETLLITCISTKASCAQSWMLT